MALGLEPAGVAAAAEVAELGRLDRDSALAVKDQAELGPLDLVTRLDQILASSQSPQNRLHPSQMLYQFR